MSLLESSNYIAVSLPKTAWRKHSSDPTVSLFKIPDNGVDKGLLLAIKVSGDEQAARQGVANLVSLAAMATNNSTIDPGVFAVVSSYMFSRVDSSYDFKHGKVTHTNLTESGKHDGALYSFVTLYDEPGMTLIFGVKYGDRDSLFTTYDEAKQFINRVAESMATKG